MTITKLDWDSAFFGLNVARSVFDGDEFSRQALSNFDVVYLFVDPNDAVGNTRAKEMGAQLADEKVTYHKRTHRGNVAINASIASYRRTQTPLDEAVVNIGLQSGIYSRFNTDKRFGHDNFVRLYHEWMNRSIDREIACEVFVALNGNRVDGVITVGEKDGCADIGLLAVNEVARGQGMGQALVATVENYCVQHGYDELQVVTQKANAPACRFYEACGFVPLDVINIYHLWNS